MGGFFRGCVSYDFPLGVLHTKSVILLSLMVHDKIQRQCLNLNEEQHILVH